MLQDSRGDYVIIDLENANSAGDLKNTDF